MSLKSKNKKRILAKAIGVALTASFFGSTALAATLATIVPSNYVASEFGTITGSRIESRIDSTANIIRGMKLNRDPQPLSYVHNGEGRIILRQYTYSTTDLAANMMFDAKVSLKDPVKSNVFPDVTNLHAVTALGEYMFLGDYDLGSLTVVDMKDDNYIQKYSYRLPESIVKREDYKDQKGFHVEGVQVIGDRLYACFTALASQSDLDSYAPSHLCQYKINKDGSLIFINDARVGKNTFGIQPYNNYIFSASVGGFQGVNDPNEEASLHAVRIDNDGTMTSKEVVDPGKQANEYRDISISSDGTAYFLAANYGGDYGGLNGNVYRTSVTNLLADNPIPWEAIIQERGNPGFYHNVEIETNPKRFWFFNGQNVWVYEDGETEPKIFNSRDFATSSAMYQINGACTVMPDTVYSGNLKKDAFIVSEGLTSPKTQITKSTLLPSDNTSNGVSGISGIPDFTSRIMGMDEYINSANYAEYSDSEYKKNGVTNDYSTYEFTKDTIIGLDNEDTGDYETNKIAAVFAKYGDDIVVNAGSNKLTLNVENNLGTPVGIYLASGKDVEVNASELNINTNTYANGQAKTTAIWVDPSVKKGSRVTVNAPVNISMAGGQGGNAVAITKSDRWGEKSSETRIRSKITINGDLTVKGANDAWGVPLNSKNVYSRFNSAGLLVNVDRGSITVNGNVDMNIYGNGIATVADRSKISVDGGHIAVPTGKGYGYYSLASYLGTINMNEGADENSTVQLDGDIFALDTGNIYIGMNNKDSYLNGIIDNAGEVDLTLKNGATWTNFRNNDRYFDDNEDMGSNGISHVTQLFAGTDDLNQGIIIQEDKNDIVIDKYTGNALVIYDHDNAKPNIINGGDIVIKSADRQNELNSKITLMTDNAGINTDDEIIVNSVLNSMASKIRYEAYATKNGSERNLDGFAQIAEGLTSKSAKIKTANINFSEETGQGTGTAVVEQSSIESNEMVTSATNKSGVLKKYSNINITEDSENSVAENSFVGVNANQADNTDLYMSEVSKISVALNPKNNSNIANAIGVMAKGEDEKAILNLKGIANIDVNIIGDTFDKDVFAYGVYAKNGEVNLYTGSKVKASSELAMLTNGANVDTYALYASGNGTINFNNDSSMFSGDSQITGDILSDNGAINLKLATDKSKLEGGSLQKNSGVVNLGLSNGATWINQSTNDLSSSVNNLTGGNLASNEGLIYQKDDKEINIENISGNILVYYDHQIDAKGNAKFIAGDVIVNNANENSAIKLRTDFIDVVESNYDKVLSGLAEKIIYKDYLKNNDNLTATAEIAEGLTATSVSWSSDIEFLEKNNGRGSSTIGELPNPPIPGDKIEFTQAITGNLDPNSSEYKEYSENSIIQKDGSYKFSEKGSSINCEDSSASAVEAKETNIKIDFNGYKANVVNKFDSSDLVASGLKTLGSDLTVENLGSMNIKVSNDLGAAVGINANSSEIIVKNSYQTVNISGTAKDGEFVGISASNGGTVRLGKVGIVGKRAIDANNGTVNILTGKLETTDVDAIRVREKGIVNINMLEDGINSDSNNVEIKGNISIEKNQGKVRAGLISKDEVMENNSLSGAELGNVNLSLSGVNSSWIGVADIEEGGTLNLFVNKGASWINEETVGTDDEFNGSKVNLLTGATRKADAGTIYQKSSKDITFGNVKGNTIVLYEHSLDEVSDIIGGKVIVEKAERFNGNNASLLLKTDNVGINITDDTSVEKVFENLASKIVYKEYDEAVLSNNKLDSFLEISEGLTSSSVGRKGLVEFASDGVGHLKEGSMSNSKSEIIYGNKETAMMRGAKNAMMSSILSLRANNTDLGERIGNISKKSLDGIWAKVSAGENSYSKEDDSYNQTFNTLQVGYNIPTSSEKTWKYGTALTYMEGDSSYELNGNGENKGFGLSMYATWIGKDNDYLDLVLAGSKIQNEYTIYNDFGHKLEGDYDATGISLSAEYGKKLELREDVYIEPQVQLTYSKIKGDSYDAYSDFGDGKVLKVEPGNLDSLLGRVGIKVGKVLESGEVYVKASLLREFKGENSSTYSALNEPISSVTESFEDTWGEIEIGGNCKVAKDLSFYADYTNSFSSDYDLEWKLNAGLRWEF